MAKKQELITLPGLLPATQEVDYGTHAGEGMSVGMEEMLIPFVGLLQKDSQECVESNPKFVEGSKAGLFINKASKAMKEKMILVAAKSTRTFEEWIPKDNGGGHVASHFPEDAVVNEAKERARAKGDKAKYPKLTTPEGNQLIETFSLFCIELNEKLEPIGFVVVPFSSTKITGYKTFRTAIGTMRGAKDMALYSFVASLTSKDDSNKKGRFKNVELSPVTGEAISSRIPPTHPAFLAAAQLKEALESGKAKADFSTAEPEAAGDDVDAGAF